jgi:hypothetical protein
MLIVIKEEFKSLIPALVDAEYALLERSIIEDGCEQPLLVWDVWGEGKEAILIDGHNRFEICQKNNIEFLTKNIEFKDERDARIWMRRHQLGRRNLSDYNRTRLALELESEYADLAKENLVTSTGGSKPQPLSNSTKAGNSINTRAKIAEEAGVSENTVAKVKVIEKNATPEIKKALSEGKMSINKAHEQVTGKTKAKPEPEAEPAIDDDGAPDEAELRQAELEERGYQEFIEKVFADEPSLAAALEENKRLNAELATVKISRDGYMNQCNAYIKQIKSLQRKLEKAGVQV